MKIAIADLLRRLNRSRTSFAVEEELHFHLEMLERKYTQSGMCVEEAKVAALKRFGNFERVRQQCADISRRSSFVRRTLKLSMILIAFTGLLIRFSSAELKVVRIGHVLIMIAVLGRLLLYVRGLSPFTVFPRTKETPLSVITESPETPRA